MAKLGRTANHGRCALAPAANPIYCGRIAHKGEEALSALKRATKLAKELLRSDGAQRPLLLDLIKRVVMHEDRIVIELSWLGVLNQLSEGGAVPSCVKPRDRAIVLTTPCQFQRRGGKMRLVIGDQSGGEGTPDLYSHRGPSPGAYMVAGALRWQCQLDQANRRSRAQ
jgi:hypothetical protein